MVIIRTPVPNESDVEDNKEIRISQIECPCTLIFVGDNYRIGPVIKELITKPNIYSCDIEVPTSELIDLWNSSKHLLFVDLFLNEFFVHWNLFKNEKYERKTIIVLIGDAFDYKLKEHMRLHESVGYLHFSNLDTNQYIIDYLKKMLTGV